MLADGRQLADQLELHLYYGNQPVWCLTHKPALKNQSGDIIGLVGTSRDLQLPQSTYPAYPKLVAVDTYIREHLARPVTLAELATIAGLYIAQLERQCKRIFQLMPRQMIHKARLGEASRLRCGHTDHSALSRQFSRADRITAQSVSRVACG